MNSAMHIFALVAIVVVVLLPWLVSKFVLGDE